MKLNKTGRIAAAEEAARRLLRKTERECGADAVEVAEVLDQLAVALRRGGKAREREALEVCERALSIKGRFLGVQDSSYAVSLRNLGMLYSARGGPQVAQPILERALSIQERILPKDHLEVAMTLSAVAASQNAQGRDTEAAVNMQRAVEIQRTALPHDDPDRALGLTALAVIRYVLGDLAEAAALGEEAAAVLEKNSAPDSPMLGNCYYNLGSIYSEMGDFEAARAVYELALRIRGRGSSPDAMLAANTSVDLGQALQRLGRLENARGRYLAALSTYKRLGEEESADAGWARSRLGLCYLEMNNTRAAYPELKEALRIQEASLGPTNWQIWTTLLGLARTAAVQGDSETAKKHYERNLSLLQASVGDSHPDFASVLAEYGSFLLTCGDTAAALTASLRAAKANTEHMRQTARGTSERQGLAYASIRPGGLDAALAILGSGTAGYDREIVESVWGEVIRQRTLILDEVTTRNQVSAADTALARLTLELERARRRLSHLSVRGPEAADVARYRVATTNAGRDAERLERTLAYRSSTYGAQRARAGVGFDEVKRGLPTGSVLVGIVSHGIKLSRAYLAFVTSRSGARAVSLGAANEIDSLVLSWRRTLGHVRLGHDAQSRRSEVACRRAGEALRKRIWDPLGPYLEGTHTVFVVPEGSMHLINWYALPAVGGGYLIESAPIIHVLHSERDLADRRDTPYGVGLLACGDPQFNAQLGKGNAGTWPHRPGPNAEGSAAVTGPVDDCDFRSVRFSQLPGAAREVGEIAAAWPDTASLSLLTGAAATERAVKERAPGRRVVHLATHGFFLDGTCSDRREGGDSHRGIGGVSSATRPQGGPRESVGALRLSGLAFAGANRRASALPDDEDGILTAEEISSLNLTGLEWAVLSACDTGLGTVQPGEGVLGLRRAFQAAGARTVIMSLWAVDDESTRQWMRELYDGRFRRGLSTARAARDASLSLLRNRRAQGRSVHPYYWAPFIATGDWN